MFTLSFPYITTAVNGSELTLLVHYDASLAFYKVDHDIFREMPID